MPLLGYVGDYRKSFFASCVVHGVVLFGTTGLLMQPPRYDVEAGTGGMEVSLIAAPLPLDNASPVPQTPRIPEEQPAQPVTPNDWVLDSVSPNAPKQSSPYVGDGSSLVAGKDPTTLYLSGGAATGKGGRFRNPAPPYPYAAIQQKQEGLVMLQAVIDQAGRPLSVEIAQSSGFPLLDQSALHTVRRWKFDAAHLGFLPIQFKILIPIRFILEERLSE